jgi:hypothetical protein
MSGANQTSKRKRRGKTLPALGVAGLSLALTSGAHAATDGTSVDKPTLNTLFSQEITLAEEEISDVSLSTFYVFDKENAQKPQLRQVNCGFLQSMPSSIQAICAAEIDTAPADAEGQMNLPRSRRLA